MSGAEEALIGAIVSAVAANEGVKAVLGDPLRFEEEGAPKPAYPYLEFVRCETRPAGALGAEASELLVDFAVVSRDAGGKLVRAAMAAVRAALEDMELEMEGWRCVLLLPVFSDATRTRPGLWRALIRVKAVVEAD